jgi:hypothetical protein
MELLPPVDAETLTEFVTVAEFEFVTVMLFAASAGKPAVRSAVAAASTDILLAFMLST